MRLTIRILGADVLQIDTGADDQQQERGDHVVPSGVRGEPRGRVDLAEGRRAMSDRDPITIWPSAIVTGQTTRELLAEQIRRGGLRWHRANNPEWREKPWADGIKVDLDEDSVLEEIVLTILEASQPEEQR